GVDREAIVGGPVQHGLAAAAQDGDVEGADLDLLQDLDSTAGRCRREAQIQDLRLRMRLPEEPLECPPSTLFDFLRNGREWHHPAEAVRLAVTAAACPVMHHPL